MTSHLRRFTSCFRHGVSAVDGDFELDGLDVGIGDPLLFGRIEARIDGRIGAFAGAQPRQRLEARRVDWIGRDVVDLRQHVVLQGEIGGIGEHGRGDQERQHDAAHAAAAVLPDCGESGEADEDGKSGDRQRAEERRQGRLNFEETEADDEDRDQHRNRGEDGEVARPCGEAGHGLLLIGSGKPAGHQNLPVKTLPGQGRRACYWPV